MAAIYVVKFERKGPLSDPSRDQWCAELTDGERTWLEEGGVDTCAKASDFFVPAVREPRELTERGICGLATLGWARE
jgi:hypothetical protein